MSSQETKRKPEEELIDITGYLSEYLRIVRRMWVWFLIFMLIGTGAGYIKGRISYVPVYTAATTFTINIKEEQTAGNMTSNYLNNAAAEQMAKTFPYILTSGILRQKVVEELGGIATTATIAASSVENTNLLTISVKDRDAGRAYTVLQSVVKNYPSISEVIIGKTYMEVLDETGIPEYPDNPRDFKGSAMKGGAVGFLLVAAWCVLLIFTRRTIRKEDEIHRYVNAKCLGSIPAITPKRRSKKVVLNKILVTEKNVSEKILENFHMIRNKMEYYVREYRHKVFVVTSAVAGEGKSTVAVNLALTFAKAGKKVALVDCDLRHPSDREVLGVEDGKGLAEILKGEEKLNTCILDARVMGLEEDLRFVFVPGGTPVEDGSEMLGSVNMERIIESMKNWADIVILDSAPSGLLTDAVVLAQYADAALFVIRKDFAKVDDIVDGMEHLAESNVQIIGTVLNGV